MFYKQILCRYCFAKKVQSQTVIREMLCIAHLYQKRCAENVNKIDYWGWSHQHFTRSFHTCRSQNWKKIQSSWLSFSCFQDLQMKNPLVEFWWNWSRISPVSRWSDLHSWVRRHKSGTNQKKFSNLYFSFNCENFLFYCNLTRGFLFDFLVIRMLFLTIITDSLHLFYRDRTRP